jgi:hypothetical protein
MWWLLLACTTERPSDPTLVDDEDPGVECADGFYEGDDGNCYEIRADEDPVDLAFAALPECHPLDPDDRLDLRDRCLDGVCVGAEFQSADDALGDAWYCDYYSDGWVDCRWEGLGVRIVTPGDIDAPDPSGAMWRVEMMPAYDGADEDGLGIGISVACWVDLLGEPDRIEFAEDGSDWKIDNLWWESGITVWDYVDESDGEGGDGLVDWVYLYE